MAIIEKIPDDPSSDTRAERLANARARMQAFLADPENMALARQVMEAPEPPTDTLIEAVQAGEFAEAAFVEGYGEAFVQELKSRHGG